ncbi:unnamed protein product [Pylaiella littoralis]
MKKSTLPATKTCGATRTRARYCLSVSQGRFRHMQGKRCCGHEDHGGAFSVEAEKQRRWQRKSRS